MSPPADPKDPRHSRGRRGEDLVAAHLVALGYSIHARNHRLADVEVDLLACRESSWAILEVKTSRARTPPEAMLRETQRSRLFRAARALRRRVGARDDVSVVLATVHLVTPHAPQLRFFRVRPVSPE